MKEKGFTLIELLIVIAIVAIMALIVFGGIFEAKARRDRINNLHERWIKNCIEERLKLDAYEGESKATEKCELKWETEVLPRLKEADKSDTDVVVIPVTTY